MKCKLCRTKKAEIFLKPYGLGLCRDDFLSFVKRRVERAIDKFKMFEEKHRVLVAISGGKDSLALLHLLKGLSYDVTGYFLDLGIFPASQEAKQRILNFSKDFGISVIIDRLDEVFVATLPEIGKIMKRPPCSYCGTLKRYFFNRRGMEFDVVVTGHTLNDEAASLFANNLRWDFSYMGRQYPVLEEERGFARKAKPLIFVSEKETAAYCFFCGIEYYEKGCPLAKGASSIFLKRKLLEIDDKRPGVMYTYLKEFLDRKRKQGFMPEEKADMRPCEECGYPTTAQGLCAVCRIRRRFVQHAEGVANNERM